MKNNTNCLVKIIKKNGLLLAYSIKYSLQYIQVYTSIHILFVDYSNYAVTLTRLLPLANTVTNSHSTYLCLLISITNYHLCYFDYHLLSFLTV